MIPGTPERRSHDYVRHGAIDLFAALNTATGKVIGHLSAQHRAAGFRDFPDEIDRQADPGLAIHLICEDLAAHKAPVVHRWLLAHPRVQLHFTPTYASWLNQVERWFAELQRRCLDCGVICSLGELTTAPGELDQDLECHRPAFQVGQDRRPDHRPHLPLLLTHLRTGSLGERPQERTQRRRHPYPGEQLQKLHAAQRARSAA